MMKSLNSNKAKHRIMLIDDIISNRLLITAQLGQLNYQVFSLEGGKNILNHLKDNPVDLILLDIVMPEIDGFDTLIEIRSAYTSIELPVVMLTASDSTKDIVRSLELGANDFIQKGADPLVLTARIESILSAQRAHQELEQAKKLRALGQLSAGLSHEINTPLQFISDNISFLSLSFERIKPILSQSMKTIVSDQMAVEKLLRHVERAKLPLIEKQVPKAFEEILSGIDRISEVITAMRSMSTSAIDSMQPICIKEIVKAAIAISRTETEKIASIETEYDEDRKILANGYEIHHVLLELLRNARQAIEAKMMPDLGIIKVISRNLSNEIEVQIQDNGIGIPANIMGRIFDPFFTTHEIGKGRGQGLSYCYDIIVNLHGGTINVESTPNNGTTISFTLPQ